MAESPWNAWRVLTPIPGFAVEVFNGRPHLGFGPPPSSQGRAYPLCGAAMPGTWRSDRLNDPTAPLPRGAICPACIDLWEQHLVAEAAVDWAGADDILAEWG